MVHQDFEFRRGEPVQVGADAADHLFAQSQAVAFGPGIGTIAEVPVGAFEIAGPKAGEEQPLAQCGGLVADHAGVSKQAAEDMFAGDEGEGRTRIGNQHFDTGLDDRFGAQVVIDTAVAQFHAVA